MFPLAFDAAVEGERSRNIATPFGVQKPEWCGYPVVEKSVMICLCLAVSIEYRRVTDRQTDGRTDISRQHSRAVIKLCI